MRLPTDKTGTTIEHGSLVLADLTREIMRVISTHRTPKVWRITARYLSGVGSIVDDTDQFAVVK